MIRGYVTMRGSLADHPIQVYQNRLELQQDEFKEFLSVDSFPKRRIV